MLFRRKPGAFLIASLLYPPAPQKMAFHHVCLPSPQPIKPLFSTPYMQENKQNSCFEGELLQRVSRKIKLKAFCREKKHTVCSEIGRGLG